MWHTWERGETCTGFLVGKPEEKKTAWMDLREIGWGGVEWIHLAEDSGCCWAVVNAVMNLRVLAPWSWLVG
jgi:hypothetical protein